MSKNVTREEPRDATLDLRTGALHDSVDDDLAPTTELATLLVPGDVAPVRVALLSRDEALAGLVHRTLTAGRGHEVDVVRLGRRADVIERMSSEALAAVLVDLRTESSFGTDAVEHLHLAFPADAIVAIVDSDGGDATASAAVRAGAEDGLPFDGMPAASAWRAIAFAIERRRDARSVQSVLDALDAPIVVHDQERTVVYVNLAARRLFHTEPGTLLGSRWPVEVTAGKSAFRALPQRDGSSLRVQVRATRTRFAGREATLLSIQDMTAQRDVEARIRRHERKLRESQHMESIGILAGGIAHDFNNLLTVIRGRSQLGMRKVQSGRDVTRDLECIEQAAKQATRLTSRLLTFARRDVVKPELVDVGEMIEESIPMLRSLVGEATRLDVDLSAGVPPIEIDPGHLEQVLLNLVANARDALPQGGEVRVTLAYESAGPDAAEGIVALTVHDDGIGMNDETQRQMFEAFFTTKAEHGGTGLGLATVRGIVKEANGRVRCRTAVGEGTTLRVEFRPATAQIDDSMSTAALDGTATSGTILVVDDDENVRAIAAEMLETSGYAVLTAEDAADALRLIEDSSNVIDLLVTDVVMPETDGPTLIVEARTHRPDLRAVMVTGYAPYADASMIPGVPLLQKPFTMAQLTEQVEAALRN